MCLSWTDLSLNLTKSRDVRQPHARCLKYSICLRQRVPSECWLSTEAAAVRRRPGVQTVHTGLTCILWLRAAGPPSMSPST